MSIRLNIGCGGRYRDGWVNLDFAPRPPNVIGHDLSCPLPFPENHASMVYASHVLEHFSRADGLRLLRECYRVLSPGGVVRIVVPDLEAIVRNYLRCLQLRSLNEAVGGVDHLWSVMTLIDQLSRNSSGGEMIDFLRHHSLDDLANIFEIEGPEIRLLHQRLSSSFAPEAGASSFRQGPRLKIRASLIEIIRRIRSFLIRLLLGGGAEDALRIGAFRRSGEVHYWMYDALSLRDALQAAGFVDVTGWDAHGSYTSDWALERLDTEPDGSVYKPLSLFMEGRKSP